MTETPLALGQMLDAAAARWPDKPAVVFEWLVVAVRPAPRLGGEIVELRGRLRNAAGETAVGAKGRVLVTARL